MLYRGLRDPAGTPGSILSHLLWLAGPVLVVGCIDLVALTYVWCMSGTVFQDKDFAANLDCRPQRLHRADRALRVREGQLLTYRPYPHPSPHLSAGTREQSRKARAPRRARLLARDVGHALTERETPPRYPKRQCWIISIVHPHSPYENP